jgi:dihydropyrimidinase
LWLWHRSFDVISTDTCDYTIGQKMEFKEFTKTPGGLPGVETLLPLVYTYGVSNEALGFDLPMLVQKLCSNPAKIFGRYPRKGALNVGSDADVVLYDPEPEGTISHEDLHYLAGYSPYQGMRVKGQVVMTLSRGEVVYQRGAEDEFPVKPGRGQFVPGDPFDAALMP